MVIQSILVAAALLIAASQCQELEGDPFYPNMTLTILGPLEAKDVKFMIDGITNNDTYIITIRSVLQINMNSGRPQFVRLLAGSQKSNASYQEGVGSEARFMFLAGAAWLNSTHLVVTDMVANCLRLVEEETGSTSRYTGHCDAPSQGNTDGSLEQAWIKSPEGIINLNDTLYCATSTGVLKVSDGYVSTLAKGALLTQAHYLTSLDGFLYVTTWSGVLKVNPTNGRASTLTRSFDFYTNIVAIESLQLLVISSSLSRQFKVVELKTYNNLYDHKRYNICTGNPGDWGYKVGTAKKCVFRDPGSLMVRGGEVFAQGFDNIFKMTFQKPKPIEFLYIAVGVIAGLPVLVVVISVIVIICQGCRH